MPEIPLCSIWLTFLILHSGNSQPWQYHARTRRTLDMNTTLWLLIMIGSLRYNNVHMHKILLCSTLAQRVDFYQGTPRVEHPAHLKIVRQALSLYISIVLYSSFRWINECPWIFFQVILQERTIGTQSQMRRRQNEEN
jgi:hypothetical protein